MTRAAIALPILLLSACVGTSPPPIPPAPLAKIAIGVYVYPNGKNSKAEIVAFEASLGQKLAIDNHYSKFAWDGDMSMEAWDIANGRIPMKSWSAGDGNGGCVLYDDILAGKQDTLLLSQAPKIKALPGKIWLRLFYEMTDSEAETCANPTKDPTKFIAAWKYVHDLFAKAGVTNAVWVWAPGEPLYAGGNESAWYPGAAYVDIIGEDPYNKTQLPEPFAAVVCAFAASQSKPSAITETGAIGTANQLVWFGNVKAACPSLTAFIPWDAVGNYDYRITDPSVFAALRAIGQ